MLNVLMISVESSNIKSIGYKDDKNKLYVQFHSGGFYCYFNVPKQVYESFLEADSKGKFFHANIKSYDYEKLN